MDSSNVVIETPFGILLVWLGRRFLDTPARLPHWDKWLARLWVPGVVVLAGALFTEYDVDLLSDVYQEGILAVGVAVGWQLRGYRPARTLGLAVLPFLLVEALRSLLALAGPRLLKSYEDNFDLTSPVAFVWACVLLVMARGQKKSLVAEHLLRLQAEQEKQRIEAQNRELERTVGQRTADLARQTDELRTTLHELKDTQAQLIQREKMASLGELTAGVAHEIQNPLNFVNNFADVSAELVAELEEARAHPTRDAGLETDLLHDLKQNLQRITQHGSRAAGIVRGMLAHSRASAGERVPTDLNALCEEYLRLAYHGLRAKDKSFNATLRPELAPGLPLVPAVGPDLGRVLLNLLTNAFYAVQQRQQGGEAGYAPTVGVRTGQVPGGGAVEVRVRDNGLGIAEAVRGKVFQPFFTTKPAGEGTGLGLSLSHDIVVKGHGGTLSVESQEGEFTEFILTLPL